MGMKLLDKKRENEYRHFLESNERCNFQQSTEWADVKENWENEIIIVEDEKGEIIASVSTLITGRLWRSPTSKSFGSWAGVILTTPVPKSVSTYSSATTGISR